MSPPEVTGCTGVASATGMGMLLVGVRSLLVAGINCIGLGTLASRWLQVLARRPMADKRG